MSHHDAIHETLLKHEARISALERLLRGNGDSSPVLSSKKQSAKEFLMSKDIRTEAQKVLALAYYLERAEGLASFNVPDLEIVFRAAREKLPKNMNDTVNKNVARGFIMEAAEKKNAKKAWQLTATGERFVEQEMGR
jgi:hypothetical protein